MRNLTDRELATVLHALRKVQEEWEARGFDAPQGDHFTEVAPLNCDEIDTLCERLNLTDATQDDRWRGASPALQAERPWCGWTCAFGGGTDWDTTQFGLEKLVGLNVLLTTADGRSRPVRIVSWQSDWGENIAGILIRELDTNQYEPLDPTGEPAQIRYEDIREIVIY